MVEVFITNVWVHTDATEILRTLEIDFPELKINFDLDYLVKPFPCGHTILRAEGNRIEVEKIISVVANFGFKCRVLEDRICI